jgi:hypothetical protein
MIRIVNRIRRILCTFSGEDTLIIGRCDKPIQIAFARIGFFVFCIFICCFVSAASFVHQTFDSHSLWVSLPVGFVWALLVTNIYLLLLYTVSPTLLPVARKKGRRKIRVSENETGRKKFRSAFTLSFILRISFISLLAILIVQPLNVWIVFDSPITFFPSVRNRLEDFKSEYRINMVLVANGTLIRQELQDQTDFFQGIELRTSEKNAVIVRNQLATLREKIAADERFLQQSQVLMDSLGRMTAHFYISNKPACDSLRGVLNRMLIDELESDRRLVATIGQIRFNDTRLQSEFEKYSDALVKTITHKIDNYYQLNALLSRSNFFIKKIQILLSQSSLSWFLTLLGCSLFLVPVYWKYSIRNRGGFYEEKQRVENEFVLRKYSEFKTRYTEIFAVKMAEYNLRVGNALAPWLEQLKVYAPKQYEIVRWEMEAELSTHPIIKYEYWADPPFRTKYQEHSIDLGSEDDLLKIIYPDKN